MCKNNLIGDRIMKVRESLALSQKEFANELQISQPAISLYEKNLRVPPKSLLKLISSRFNVNIEYLTTGEKQMFNIQFNKEELFDEFCNTYNLDQYSQIILHEYISLPDSHRQVISSYLKKIANSLINQNNK